MLFGLCKEFTMGMMLINGWNRYGYDNSKSAVWFKKKLSLNTPGIVCYVFHHHPHVKKNSRTAEIKKSSPNEINKLRPLCARIYKVKLNIFT